MWRMKEHRSLLRTPYCVNSLLPYSLLRKLLIAVLAERQIVIWQKVLIFCLSNGADTRI